jgi:hypothetical protein
MHTEATERQWLRTPRTAKKRKPASGGTTSGTRHILRGPTWAIGCKQTRTRTRKWYYSKAFIKGKAARRFVAIITRPPSCESFQDSALQLLVITSVLTTNAEERIHSAVGILTRKSSCVLLPTHYASYINQYGHHRVQIGIDRDEIWGVFLPSQLERTRQLCIRDGNRLKGGVRAPPTLTSQD